jgi:putative phage-type endonuclease
VNREQWLIERQKGIGGSDAAAALGLSKWKTPYQLYLEKRGEAAPDEESLPMKVGTALEPLVIQLYADATGRDVVRNPFEITRHATIPHMLATLDGRAEGRVVEAKTAATKEGWGEPGTDEIPQEYLIQVQHVLIVTALPVADVPVLFGNREFETYEVPADRELQDMIRDAEEDFWQLVRRGEPPAPVTMDDAKARYRKSITAGVQASREAIEACTRLAAVKAQQEALKQLEEQLKVTVCSELGHNDTLLAGRDILATWKLTKPRQHFDLDTFRRDNAELASAYTHAAEPSRRFLLKGL